MPTFNTDNDSFEITASFERGLMIEATADYGDSYTGWGSTCTSLYLDREKMRALRDFLNSALEFTTGND